ncbi:ribonuclease H-like domain-containing protein [Halobium salinum]|uniref:Ribonuclease H-like domain-containing protein n=1 Tax=Halobium salinum TaxID=1364940 RepID=A0ABD5PF24_9EURY|nr:ribonuclease H-like domain-containing protein [Halobium salinum]
MDILAFSDWRVQPIDDLYRLVESINTNLDLILYSGDDLSRFVEEGSNYLDELADRAGADLGFVRGNDDLPAAVGPELETDRVHDLHRNPYQHGNYVVVGQEGAIGSEAIGPLTYSEQEVREHLREFSESYQRKRIILVTHTPPYGILDIGQRFGERHLGSKAVYEFIESMSPELTVCGHVHQFGGQTEFSKFGPIVNVASHDDPNADGRFATIQLSSIRSEINHSTINQRLADPLTKLNQVGNSRAKLLREAGFEELRQFTRDRREELLRIDHVWEDIADKILIHAEAYRTGQPLVVTPEPFAALQSRKPVLVDIETNLRQDRIWLIGAYSYRDVEFTQFLEPDDEAGLCKSFYEYLQAQSQPVVAYYAGQGFDERILQDRMESHDINLSDVVEEWVDVCPIARKNIFVPAPSHRLSTIATSLNYEFTYPDISGFEIGGAYSRYLTSGEPPDWEKYQEYNRDDVMALKHILSAAAADNTNPSD